jgi:predicted RNase H-like HicB family nuclease
MAQIFKVPLVLTPQPDGGYTVTSPVLPELVTEGDTLEQAIGNVQDTLEAVIEIYEDLVDRTASGPTRLPEEPPWYPTGEERT